VAKKARDKELFTRSSGTDGCHWKIKFALKGLKKVKKTRWLWQDKIDLHQLDFKKKKG